MPRKHSTISLVTILILGLDACVTTPSSPTVSIAAGAATRFAEQQPTGAAPELAKLKVKLMAADYRADLEELARLRERLSPWKGARELGHLAHYWSGFASWRMAINGANRRMKSDELRTHLKNAASDFYSAVQLKDDFADGYAAAAMVNSWLATFHMAPAGSTNADAAMARARERLSLSRALFARATALDPENPRVLWARGAFLVYTPESQGGSIARAIEVYRQMLKEADRRGVDAASPLPDWGKPEALMSIAYAHLRQTPPDLAAAREEASAALKLEPDWSYVRDILLPQIEERLNQAR